MAESMKPSVLNVGYGRGFVIEHRFEQPPFEGKRIFADRRLVVTAAHCLPHLPPRHAGSFWPGRTYRDLLGPLDGDANVWAECLFVDPVADVAVLGEPDDQEIGAAIELPDDNTPNDAYHNLTDEPIPFRIGRIAQQGWEWEGWARLLGLDGEWVRVKASLHGRRLWIEGTPHNQPGISGSPILGDDGSAIGVVVMGGETVTAEGARSPARSGPHPVLAHDLPGWLREKSLTTVPNPAMTECSTDLQTWLAFAVGGGQVYVVGRSKIETEIPVKKGTR